MKLKRFCSGNEERTTPNEIFLPLNREFSFDCDVAASKENAKCKKFFDKSINGLKQNWRGTCWLNPPFGQKIKTWVEKANEESKKGCVIVCLLPVRTNTNYWHNYIIGRAEIRYIKGYPKFNNAKQGLKTPLAIVIFRGK